MPHYYVRQICTLKLDLQAELKQNKNCKKHMHKHYIYLCYGFGILFIYLAYCTPVVATCYCIPVHLQQVKYTQYSNYFLYTQNLT